MIRVRGSVTPLIVLILAVVSMMSLVLLHQTQQHMRHLMVLDTRQKFLDDQVKLRSQLLQANSDVSDSRPGFDRQQFVLQGRFNLADLFDRLGTNAPQFLDEKMAKVLSRLIPLCGLPTDAYAAIIDWVRLTPEKQRSIPIDGLVSSNVLSNNYLNSARKCFRFDPKIHRTQVHLIEPKTAAAWFDIPITWVENSLPILHGLTPLSSANLDATLREKIGVYYQDGNQDLGYSGAASVVSYVMFYNRRPYSIWTIEQNRNGVKKILNRRHFWQPSGD